MDLQRLLLDEFLGRVVARPRGWPATRFLFPTIPHSQRHLSLDGGSAGEANFPH